MARLPSVLEVALPVLSGLLLVGVLGSVWFGRLWYPFDLEWMEGGMLAHAWRLDQGLPLYVPPNPDFVPFVYPPGYPAVVALVGKVVGLTVVVGRGVSVVSILAAAAAVGFGVRRAGGGWPLALGSAAVFLGTYPQAGAFYDLVRPDSLGIALAGWAVVLAVEPRKGAPVVAGLLLCASFLVKQNAAILGVPIALGLLLLHGWRPAAQFVLASALPALAAVALLDWSSDGGFLTWMVDVPASHVLLWTRARIDVPREWGTALPVAWGLGGGALVLDAVRHARAPRWLAAGLPVWAGMLAGWWGTYEVPLPGAQVLPIAYAFAYWGVTAGIVALAMRLVTGRTRPEPRQLYELAVLGCAGAMALVMRVHDSGFVNVHTPLFWSLAWAFGCLLARWRPVAPVTVAVALAVQLVWSASLFDRSALVPTEADAAVGWRLVRRIQAVDGPVLSPFGAWIPTYAGRPPSLHAMGVWDCNYPGGPYQDDLATIQRALREHRWTLVIGGEYPLVGDLTEHYEPRAELIPSGDPRFRPKTGFPPRPWRILIPRDEE